MKRLATAAALMLAVCGGVSNVQADDHSNPAEWDAFALRNSTGATISYEISWGAEWKSYTLEPGKLRNHAYRLSAPHNAPMIRFASGGGMKSYRLQTNEADTIQGGIVHSFRMRPEGNLDLFVPRFD